MRGAAAAGPAAGMLASGATGLRHAPENMPDFSACTATRGRRTPLSPAAVRMYTIRLPGAIPGRPKRAVTPGIGCAAYLRSFMAGEQGAIMSKLRIRAISADCGEPLRGLHTCLFPSYAGGTNWVPARRRHNIFEKALVFLFWLCYHIDIFKRRYTNDCDRGGFGLIE